MRAIGLAMVIAAVLCGAAAPVGEHLREQRLVTVGGTQEVWRLVWTGKPRPFCSVDDPEMSNTCPCSGWAYGQAGKLALVRTRQGREVERMDLGPFFGDYDYPSDQVRTGDAYLQLWPESLRDIGRSADPRLASEVKRRPRTEAMHLADYDRDGAATEFLIQVGVLACGKHQFAAVGVSKANPHLHALGSAAHPDKPLVMPRRAWEALLHSSHPAPVLIWQCDDHGSEVRSMLEVSVRAGRIRAIDRDYACASGQGPPDRLVQQTEW